MSSAPSFRPGDLAVDVADRCGLVAAWTSAVLSGRVAPDLAMSALRHTGGPLAGSVDAGRHQLLEEDFDLRDPTGGAPDPGPTADPTTRSTSGATAGTGPADVAGLAGLLALCRRLGVDRLWCAPAAAGDTSLLPGPPELNAAAVDVGGAVLLSGSSLALVPALTEHGPADDRVHRLNWRLSTRAVRTAPGGEAPPGPSLAEADRALLVALEDAVTALDHLDVAAFDPHSEGLRRGDRAALLPPGAPQRAGLVRDRALVVLRAVDLAGRSEGAAVSASAMAGRSAALRPAAAAARAALAAAWNAAPVTTGPGAVSVPAPDRVPRTAR